MQYQPIHHKPANGSARNLLNVVRDLGDDPAGIVVIDPKHEYPPARPFSTPARPPIADA